jgi:hypothetical protein
MEKTYMHHPRDDQGCTVVVIGYGVRMSNELVTDCKDKYRLAELNDARRLMKLITLAVFAKPDVSAL